MSTGGVIYAAKRYMTMQRGALGLLARLRNDMQKSDPELEGDASIWAEELDFLHQALYDASNDLDAALSAHEGEGRCR